MHLRHTEPSRTFHVTGGGAGISLRHPCEHGQPAVSLHLFSQSNGRSDDIGILMPMCTAPGLFGAVIAFIDEAMGTEAGDDFLATIQKSRDAAARQIAHGKAERRATAEACCEAGYRTQGREHTCGSSTPPATA
ncbi:hypothetical protein AB0C80_18270 [Streptomyces anthocyanicus]|uniref:hypothetical protein n=1 Tax=Streptomyces anthocyanicus TaxID=68174 RepID=UPI0033FA56D8